MKKSYSALIQPLGEINQFATISTDGQVLLWEKKFLDPQKKPITDVTNHSFSTLSSTGRQATVSISSGLREEVQWVALTSPLIATKRGQSSLGLQTKENCLFVTGPQDQQMKLVARTTP